MEVFEGIMVWSVLLALSILLWEYLDKKANRATRKERFGRVGIPFVALMATAATLLAVTHPEFFGAESAPRASWLFATFLYCAAAAALSSLVGVALALDALWEHVRETIRGT